MSDEKTLTLEARGLLGEWIKVQGEPTDEWTPYVVDAVHAALATIDAQAEDKTALETALRGCRLRREQLRAKLAALEALIEKVPHLGYDPVWHTAMVVRKEHLDLISTDHKQACRRVGGRCAFEKREQGR